MAALSGTELARTTARFGVMRFGAFRFGFAPKDTQGATPGSQGGLYVWRKEPDVTTTWTPATEKFGGQ